MVLRVAIVGCGDVSKHHARAWKKNGCRISSVCDISKESAIEFAEHHDVSNWYQNFEDMLSEMEIDIVDICTPPQSHKELALKALDAGFDLFIEKPISLNHSDAEKIAEKARKENLNFWVSNIWLFMPTIDEASSKIERGEIGELRRVDITIFQTRKNMLNVPTDSWIRELPKGNVGEMLPHPLYTLQYFLGELEVLDKRLTKVGTHPEWISFDELYALFEGTRGLGSVDISFNHSRYDVFIVLDGEKGTLAFNLFGKLFSRFENSKEWKKNILHFKPQISLFMKSMPLETTDEFARNIDAVIKEKVKGEPYPLGPDMASNRMKVFQEVLREQDYVSD